MAGRVCVNLKGVGRVSVLCLLQHGRSKRRREIMRRGWVIDPEVEVDLLRRAVGPVGRDMVRRQLHSDPRLTVDQNHVPVLFGVDRATKQFRPEAALYCEVGGVEHDDLEVDLHADIVASTMRHRVGFFGTSARFEELLNSLV